MTQLRPRLAAALLRELRTPLARVALAASQLEREAINPVGHALAVNIEDAVSQLDRGIARLLPLLADDEHAEAALSDLAEVIRPLVRRLAPAIAARDARLEVDDASFAGVPCERHLMRRATVALLRAGGRWLGRGGALRLSLARDAGRSGLRIECAAGDARARDDADFLALEPGFPGVAEVEIQLGEHDACATLWLGSPPRRDQAPARDPGANACAAC